MCSACLTAWRVGFSILPMRKEKLARITILILLLAAVVGWGPLENPQSVPSKAQLEEFDGYFPVFKNGQTKKAVPGDAFALVSNVFYQTDRGMGRPSDTRDGRQQDFEALRLEEIQKLQTILGDLMGEGFFLEHVIMLPVRWFGKWRCDRAEGCYPEGRILAVGPLSRSKAKRLCADLAQRGQLCFVMSRQTMKDFLRFQQ